MRGPCLDSAGLFIPWSSSASDRVGGGALTLHGLPALVQAYGVQAGLDASCFWSGSRLDAGAPRALCVFFAQTWLLTWIAGTMLSSVVGGMA